MIDKWVNRVNMCIQNELGWLHLFLGIVLLVDNPVVLVIIFVSESFEQVLEQGSQIGIVWLVFELQCSAVRAILDELIREALAEVFNFGHDFLFLDLFILLLDVFGSEIHPWERAAQEVHEHIAEAFNIVSSGLLNTQMGRDRSITGGTGQTFAFTVLDVLSSGGHVLFGKTKIKDEDSVRVLVDPKSKVVWLDISVDNSARVDVLDTLDHLVGNHEDSFDREFAVHLGESIFKGQAEQVHDHDVLVAFDSIIEHLGDSLRQHGRIAVEPEVDFAFGIELLMLRVDLLKFDSNFFLGFQVGCLPDLSKSTITQFFAELVVLSDN